MNLDTVFEPLPFDILGGFQINPDDLVPYEKARHAVLIGNIGGAMFETFANECDPLTDSLDCWTEARLSPLANELGAVIYFPFSKPALPFQRWARRANAGFASPLGLNIHPVWGLWHGYRALLAFEDEVTATYPACGSDPCATCADKLCLSTCPVDAFDGDTYDVEACGRYLMKKASKTCHNDGCMARLACPVGTEYHYSKAQMQFHMSSFTHGIWSTS